MVMSVREILAVGGLVAVAVSGFWLARQRETDDAKVHCMVFKANEMAWIPGGEFAMGSNDFYQEERPVRTVKVDGFWIDRHELTNREFAKFVSATGYVTDAERLPPPVDGAPDELEPGSAVFAPVTEGSPAEWHWVKGANWRHPDGPGSSAGNRNDEPVVQLSLADVRAYANWVGKDLPTETQWEFAARGGLDGKAYAWGDTRDPNGRYMANYYQGVFPVRDTGSDGHAGRAPIGCYPPNRFGLYDMIGNVWEWTASSPLKNDPVQADGRRAVVRGGSFLCSQDYCQRYRPAARQFQEMDLGTNHIGVRFVRNRPRLP